MKIWVDADACPKPVKEIVFRVAGRTKIQVTLVANQYLLVPPSPYISFLLVESGFNVADARIIELCGEDDLVVTADIPLADGVIKKGAVALNPRGQLYTSNNIAPILSARNHAESMRGGLVENVTGPPVFNAKDRENFANAIDKFMMGRK